MRQRRAEVIKFLESGDSTAATELMLATLGFVTYAPMPTRMSEDTANNVDVTSSNPDVHESLGALAWLFAVVFCDALGGLGDLKLKA